MVNRRHRSASAEVGALLSALLVKNFCHVLGEIKLYIVRLDSYFTSMARKSFNKICHMLCFKKT